MRRTVVMLVATLMLVIASLVATPRNAQSQVVVIIGNGSAQPYYPPPYAYPYAYPYPYPHAHVLNGGGYYPGGYGYLTSDYGYYNGYDGGAYRHYGYGW
jgi:hypothetical protein